MSEAPFVDHLGLADKRAEIRRYAQRFPGLRVFVETGIFAGDCTALHLADWFRTLHVIDLETRQCLQVEQKAVPNLLTWPGSSADVLPRLLAELHDPALFWLDAHLWAGHPLVRPDQEVPPAPLLAELQAIRSWPHGAQSVVLVDDVRQLGVEADRPELAEVLELVYPAWRVEIAEDIIRCTPS